MSKPTWNPVLYEHNGKFFTGYQGNINTSWFGKVGERPVEVELVHTTQKLQVKLDGISRGRSAANMYLIDTDGERYMMSFKGAYTMILKLLENKICGEDGWFTARFKQTKQGKNYFIEIV